MKNSKSRLLQVVTMLFAIAAFAVSAGAATYTVASVKGSFSFLMNKSTADPTTHQDATLGVFHFDGAGNCTVSYTDVAGGVTSTGSGSGTYTVNANGTGTITITGGAQIAFVLNSTAAGLAHDLQLLVTNKSTNDVSSGVAVLQSTAPATYSLKSVNGKFGFRFNESTADVAQPQIGGIGVLSFNGAGKVSVSFTQMKGGVLSSGSGSGTYTMNADGSGNISLTVGADNPQIAFVVNTVAVNTTTGLGSAKGVQLLQTNEGGNNRTDSGSGQTQ